MANTTIQKKSYTSILFPLNIDSKYHSFGTSLQSKKKNIKKSTNRSHAKWAMGIFFKKKLAAYVLKRDLVNYTHIYLVADQIVLVHKPGFWPISGWTCLEFWFFKGFNNHSVLVDEPRFKWVQSTTGQVRNCSKLVIEFDQEFFQF